MAPISMSRRAACRSSTKPRQIFSRSTAEAACAGVRSGSFGPADGRPPGLAPGRRQFALHAAVVQNVSHDDKIGDNRRGEEKENRDQQFLERKRAAKEQKKGH